VQEIQEHCRNGGFRDMRYDGLKKVPRGLTSIQEIDRVTLSEDF
jgi:type II secretory ATPase GspE/PulE/Tfp pilus assembly ATPase PilB-like protein